MPRTGHKPGGCNGGAQRATLPRERQRVSSSGGGTTPAHLAFRINDNSKHETSNSGAMSPHPPSVSTLRGYSDTTSGHNRTMKLSYVACTTTRRTESTRKARSLRTTCPHPGFNLIDLAFGVSRHVLK